jgi:hypothetical protein
MELEYNGKELENFKTVYPDAQISTFEEDGEIFLMVSVKDGDIFYISEDYRDYEGSLQELMDHLSNQLDTIMKKLVSKTGRTTKLVDKYIQELFDGNVVEVKDHDGTHGKISSIIRRRLFSEHKNFVLVEVGNTMSLNINE